MSKALGEPTQDYEMLLKKGKQFLENDLYNGEYFYQKVVWEGLQTPSPLQSTSTAWNVNYSPEALELLKKEGPKYQYGTGCLSDGVIGCWIANICGLTAYLDQTKVANHLKSVYKYNFKTTLVNHINPQRSSYALGTDGGLLLCTWPRGGQPTLPFVYSNEVWTGIEYQVASHLLIMGEVDKALAIVREVRKRYDGKVRNPFDEYECGHWYARAMSSYALLQGITGVRYDAIDKTLYIDSKLDGDFKSFLSTETGYGLVGIQNGKPFVDVKFGTIDVKRIVNDQKKS